MAEEEDELSLLLTAEPLSVPVCRRRVRGFLARRVGDEDLAFRVCLAVSEAVANAVVHAFRHRPDRAGAIVVRLALADGELAAVVCDDGCGPVPRDDSPGAGLGLPLIAELSDHVAVAVPLTGGTEITMRFRLVPGPAAAVPAAGLQLAAAAWADQAASSGSTRAVAESGSTV